MIRFVHTADLQLGKPYRFLEGDAAAEARRVRRRAWEAVLELAKQRQAFVLVAGDLFDANTVGRDEVAACCDAARRAGVEVVAIPGNHDHGGPDSVYRRPDFERHRPENLRVLLDGEPVLVGEGGAVVLPAPLLRRHELADPTAHWDAELGRDLAPDAVRIGLAHGGVHGFGEEDGAANEVDLRVIERARLDYLGLGDWHGLKQVHERAWYPGTPEADRFKDNDPGHALVVTLEGPGAAPEVEVVGVGELRWLRHSATLRGSEDVEALRGYLDGLEDHGRTLLRLELAGALSRRESHALKQVLEDAEARLLHLRERGEVRSLPSAEELAELPLEGYVAATARELAARAAAPPTPEAEDQDDPATAAAALDLLYRLVSEATS